MPPKTIGELLVGKNIITEAQLEKAAEEAKKIKRPFGEVLISNGLVSEAQLAQAQSEQLGVAYLDLSKYASEPGITESLPLDLARKRLALPLFKSATAITVAMSNPLDKDAVQEIQQAMKTRIRPVFSAASQILKRIEEEYGKSSSPEVARDIEDLQASSRSPADAASLASVVSIVDNLIAKAVEMAASDIHLEPQGANFYCRYRIDGLLHDMPKLPKQYEGATTSRIKIMANMDIAEKRLPQDGRIQTVIGKRSIDLRISTFPTMHGENVVIRILDKSRSLLTLEQLGMPFDSRQVFEEMIRRPHGIILVTGPTGSGKTTTLYAVLTKINSTEKNIMTMEDPIEYEVERVRQSQVNVKAGLTFASGLRSIVRQDPDIIMIGEIRDFETAEIAIHAALTGHLVFSTLHTNDAFSAATRLIDMGVEPFLVSSALICIVAQRLIRVLCPKCKEPYAPGQELLDELNIKAEPGMQFYREKGCRVCHQSGFIGRLGLFEMLIPDSEIQGLINKKAPANIVRETAVRKGIKALRDDGIAKLESGVTSLSEVLRVTQEA